MRVGGRVVARPAEVFLRDAEFRVSQAGRLRALREGRRNVHAGVVGEEVGGDPGRCVVRVGYDPFGEGCFRRLDTGAPVLRARGAVLRVSGGRAVVLADLGEG